MLPAEVIDDIRLAQSYQEDQSSDDNDAVISPAITTSTFSSLGFGGNVASSATPYSPDPHAVSEAEAQFYYAGPPLSPRSFTAREKSSGTCPEDLGPSAV